MAIDFTVDILPFYDTDVKTETAYQTPGDFGLPDFFGSLSLATVAIDSGNAGSGYTAGDTVTLSGGTLFSGGAAATATVVTVDGGGAATSVAVATGGHYSVQPSDPISTTTTGGGSGLKLDGTWTGFATQRLLTFIEISRSYLDVIDNTHEAKLLQEVLGRMTAAMRFGTSPWNQSTMSAQAQAEALKFIAHHVLAADL